MWDEIQTTIGMNKCLFMDFDLMAFVESLQTTLNYNCLHPKVFIDSTLVLSLLGHMLPMVNNLIFKIPLDNQ